MNSMYANQITLTAGENEVLLHFSQLLPEYDVEGKVTGTRIADAQTIILAPIAFEKMKEAIDAIAKKDKE